jgi:hypothetical protein
MDTEEYRFQCPYCWQQISMVLDLSVAEQSFVEDCEGCCSPISVSYRVVDGEVTEFASSGIQQ